MLGKKKIRLNKPALSNTADFRSVSFFCIVTALLLSGILSFFVKSAFGTIVFFLPFLAISAKLFDLCNSCVSSSLNISPYENIRQNKTLIIMSVDGSCTEKIFTKIETLIKNCNDPNCVFGAVISPSPSLCLTKQSDTLLADRVNSIYKHLCKLYGNKFCFFIRKREYDPWSKCFLCTSRRFDDLHDIINFRKIDTKDFECILGEDCLDGTDYTLSVPFEVRFDYESANKMIKALSCRNDPNDAMLESSVIYRVPSMKTLFSLILSYSYKISDETKGIIRSGTLASEYAIYAFDNSVYRQKISQKTPFDLLSDKLRLKVAHYTKVYAPSDISPITFHCRESEKLMSLLNGFSCCSFDQKLKRFLNIAHCLDLFIAFLLIISSVSSRFSNEYITLSILLICLPIVEILIFSFGLLIKKRFKEFSVCLLFSPLILFYRLSILPFSFTVSAYLLIKKAFSFISGRAFSGIDFDSTGLFSVLAFSGILFGLVFFVFDTNSLRRIFSLFWLFSPVLVTILTLKQIRTPKTKFES